MRKLQGGAPTTFRLAAPRTHGGALCLVLGAFILDRGLKLLASHTTTSPSGGVWFISYSLNVAGPFSLPLPFALLLILGIAVLAAVSVVVWLAWQQSQAERLLGAGLLMVGGVSNIFDRLVFGGVIDLFQLTLWGTLSFNLADVYLTAGVAVLALHGLAKATKGV